MNWKFWKKTEKAANGSKPNKPAKPREIPEAVGRKLVVEKNIDPDEVWSLRYVSNAMDELPGAYAFRLFDPEKARTAGVDVKDWTTLDTFPDLILYQGIYRKTDKRVDIHETLAA